MSSATITINVEPEIKKEAQKLAEQEGVSLGELLKRYLQQFVKAKKLAKIRDNEGEMPSPYLIRSIKQAEMDRKTGKASPVFEDIEEAIAWLHR